MSYFAGDCHPCVPFTILMSSAAGLAKEEMAEMIPVDGGVPPCPLGVAVALQEDGASVSLSSGESEMSVERCHSKNVLEGLNRLQRNSAMCDVILCCGGHELPCHRNVLAACSTYFERMFTSGTLESTQERVKICDVEPEVLSMLVDYAYNSKVFISKANVQALLAASNLLDVKSVKEACCGFLRRHMNEKNCIGLHGFADVHACTMLAQHCKEYIIEHFSDIYQQEEFLSLPVERLTEILASDLNVPTEDMLFEAAMLWLNKCPTHRRSFEKVLEQIRLPLISASNLRHVIKSLEVVKQYQGCQRFISEAKERLVVPYCNTARQRRTTVIVTMSAVTMSACGSNTHIMQSFDPLTNQWKTLGCLPLKVSGYAVVMSGSTLYVAGGEFSNYGPYSREMWSYDFHRNAWSKMADMYDPRVIFSLVMLDGHVFAVGGEPDEKTSDSIEFYNPNTNTWSLREGVGVALHADLVVGLGGLLYCIGGASNHKYNYKTDLWTRIPPMLNPRDRSAACSLNGKIYVIGGQRRQLMGKGKGRGKGKGKGKLHWDQITEDTMECYNPKTNQWTRCAAMHVRRYFPKVAALDGKIYVLGGLDDERCVRSIEQYCEETDTWDIVGELSTRHYGAVQWFECVCVRLRNDHAHTADEDDTQ